MTGNGNTSFVNSGMITVENAPYGTATAYVDDSAAGHRDIILNTGQLLGNVDLGAGNDTFDGSEGIQTGVIRGEAGNDIIFGGSGNEVLYGGTDDDTIVGAGGDDTLSGDTGNDLVRGGYGDDTVYSGTGETEARGGSGDDTMFGATFDFANSDVTLLGGRGDDIIQDYDDSSLIRGQRDDDTIKAGGGRDVIFGNKGDDVLKGGNGADLIYGGRDDDEMTGGSGRDTFIFGRNHGTDVILDFADNFDRLDLSAFGFASAAEVRAEAEDIGSAVEIDLTGQGGGILVIEDFTRAQITSADLIL